MAKWRVAALSIAACAGIAGLLTITTSKTGNAQGPPSGRQIVRISYPYGQSYGIGGIYTYVVPAGKTLVVDSVSGVIIADPGGKFDVRLEIDGDNALPAAATDPTTTSWQLAFSVPELGPAGGSGSRPLGASVYGFSQAATIRVRSGKAIRANVNHPIFRAYPGGQITLSGYLE